jgi:hypothetical protein
MQFYQIKIPQSLINKKVHTFSSHISYINNKFISYIYVTCLILIRHYRRPHWVVGLDNSYLGTEFGVVGIEVEVVDIGVEVVDIGVEVVEEFEG